MKVENLKGSAIAAANAKTLKKTEEAELKEAKNSRHEKTGEATSRNDSARIEMSREAMAMQKAKQLASPNGIDEAKVARLQKLIDEGKYHVDASALADRVVDEHLKMGT